MKLLIVESPKKAKTISEFLPNDYTVTSSYGHIVSLIRKSNSVDTTTFEGKYVLTETGRKQIKLIKQLIENELIKEVYLCTDPDREGEAIAYWLKVYIEKEYKDLIFKRAVFHEISKKAVLNALNESREIDYNLVKAQKARNHLDYLVGFNLSPLLWRKVKAGTSAGRVQSPALRLVTEREEAIKSFKAEKYFNIELKCRKENDSKIITAKLFKYKDINFPNYVINLPEATSIIKDIQKETSDIKKVLVTDIKKKRVTRKPKAPFKTSTMQQEAFNRLNMSAKHVMDTAQKLFESGYITYMRTDNTNLSPDSVKAVRSAISELYGSNLLSSKERVFENNTKNAQEAHEAIRPTDFTKPPNKLVKELSPDLHRLYTLIWIRTLSSQMKDALVDTTTVELKVNECYFRASGSVLIDKGFLEFSLGNINQYLSKGKLKEEEDKELPFLEINEELIKKEIYPVEKETTPPNRFNEASLIQKLEDYGIGRPSTYANILTKLKTNGYVESDGKRLFGTDIGELIIKYLVNNFSKYVDYDFTALIEKDLDLIANGETDYLRVMSSFWKDLNESIIEKQESTTKSNTLSSLDEKCPECNSNLEIRLSKKGNKYIACTECKYFSYLDNTVEGRVCPKCSSKLRRVSFKDKKNKGKKIEFNSCSNYPNCTYKESLDGNEILPKVKEEFITKDVCPKCSKGNLVAKCSKRGKLWYSCNNSKCKHYITTNTDFKEFKETME